MKSFFDFITRMFFAGSSPVIAPGILSVYCMLILLFCFQACDHTAYTEPPPVSEGSELRYDAEGDYFLIKPVNYSLNDGVRYPLLIYLHGLNQSGYITNLYPIGLGYRDPDYEAQYQKETADAFRNAHPCFVYVPQEPGSPWDTAKLIRQIEGLKKIYRLDTGRFYVMGFSMGGWGSTSLARDYYDYNGQLFAAIVCMAGANQYVLTDGSAAATSIIEHTRIWLNAGQDDSGPLDTGRTLYAFLLNHEANVGAYQSSASYSITDVLGNVYTADTFTMTLNGVEKVKKTEFPGVGHMMNNIVLADPGVIEWIFEQSL